MSAIPAHELKTAIAVVRSSVQLLMLKRRTGEEYSAGLDRILEDTERLERLVAQMLQLARLEEGSAAEVERIELGGVLRSTAMQLQPIAMSRGVTVAVQNAAGLMIRMPLESAEVLVSNLLLNAIEHSKADSTVSLSAVPDAKGRIRLEIADSGEGVGAEALPHIFERFFREDTSRSRITGGTGLGLAICKSITDAAGAIIAVESKRGTGTRVTVTFSAA